MNRYRATPPTWAWATAVLLPLAAVAAALYTQFRMDMQPCPWCVLQRAQFVAISLVGLPGWLVRVNAVRKVSALLITLLAASGVAAALWQHFVAASSTSCAMTLADRIVRGAGLDELSPDVFSATANCAEAATTLLGLPYEFYSLAIFALLVALGLAMLLQRQRR